MKKSTFITKRQIDDITAKYPTPFHLYDEKGIRDKARALNNAFAWTSSYGGFREYFAVKATPNPHIMQILLEEGCGFDCSSYTELLLAESLLNGRPEYNADSPAVMFSSNQTPDEDFLLADKVGAIINLDDFTHIENVVGLLKETISIQDELKKTGEIN